MFKACYTDSDMFSAIPLDEGWYGGTLQFLIPLLVIKWRNCFDENGGPLSDTSVTRSQICTLAYQQFVLLKSNSPQTLQAISNRWQQWPSNGHDQHGYIPKDHVALTKDVLVLLGKWKLSGSTVHMVLNSRVKLGSPHITSGQCFHAAYSHMIAMKLLKQYVQNTVGITTILPHVQKTYDSARACDSSATFNAISIQFSETIVTQ